MSRLSTENPPGAQNPNHSGGRGGGKREREQKYQASRTSKTKKTKKVIPTSAASDEESDEEEEAAGGGNIQERRTNTRYWDEIRLYPCLNILFGRSEQIPLKTAIANFAETALQEAVYTASGGRNGPWEKQVQVDAPGWSEDVPMRSPSDAIVILYVGVWQAWDGSAGGGIHTAGEAFDNYHSRGETH